MKSGANGKTEAPAGWYRQFKRKQGYKHDGVVRTPNSTRISSINENVDRTPSLDPYAPEYRGLDGKYWSSNQFDLQAPRTPPDEKT